MQLYVAASIVEYDTALSLTWIK